MFGGNVNFKGKVQDLLETRKKKKLIFLHGLLESIV